MEVAAKAALHNCIDSKGPPCSALDYTQLVRGLVQVGDIAHLTLSLAHSPTSRGRGTGFARPQAPDRETQSFYVPSKPALQAWRRGTQPPRGAGRYTK